MQERNGLDPLMVRALPAAFFVDKFNKGGGWTVRSGGHYSELLDITELEEEQMQILLGDVGRKRSNKDLVPRTHGSDSNLKGVLRGFKDNFVMERFDTCLGLLESSHRYEPGPCRGTFRVSENLCVQNRAIAGEHRAEPGLCD